MPFHFLFSMAVTAVTVCSFFKLRGFEAIPGKDSRTENALPPGEGEVAETVHDSFEAEERSSRDRNVTSGSRASGQKSRVLLELRFERVAHERAGSAVEPIGVEVNNFSMISYIIFEIPDCRNMIKYDKINI